MTQFVALNTDVEVNGQTVIAIANGLGSMKETGLRILAENGITDPHTDHWYPQQLWLNAFKQISEKVGIKTLHLIGTSIPENANFPPEINDVHKALASIDVAYHMNHRIKNKIMFDMKTGKLDEGIGHYHYKKLGEKSVEITCDNPYPCDFDQGIITAMAKKFLPAGTKIHMDHDEAKGCRKKGGSKCTYIISW